MPTEREIVSFVESVVEPSDFDSFWQNVLSELRRIPMEPEVTPVPLRSTPKAQVYEVRYNSLDGLRIAGWYCVPSSGQRSFPALVQFPGYQGEPALARHWAERGVATLTVAVRGKLRSNQQFNPGYPGLLTYGLESRESYPYKGIIADCVRGVDFLLSRPEVDKEHVCATGSSQGGGLAIICTALHNGIRGGVAGFPFLCAYLDAMRLTRSYPYNELNCYLRSFPDRYEQMATTLSYFDCVNFAKRIKQPMAVGIGMEDDVCPPQTCYAAYKQMHGTKEAWLFSHTGHVASSPYTSLETDWLQEHLGL